MTRKPATKDGIALVLTLGILVIATILVIGFTSSMRTERQAAASIANNLTATILTQAAIDHATSLLEHNIPAPLGPGIAPAPQNWSINPGRLTLFSGATTTIIPLYSGDPANAADPNLNQPKLDGTNYEILGSTNSPMRVAWVNVIGDPSRSPSSTNPLVGRYAFWLDDENSKVNINTAFGKPFPAPIPTRTAAPAGNTTGRYTRGNPPFTISSSTYTLGHPASVELGVFTGLNATALRNASSYRPLASVSEIKQFVASGSQGFYEANKFYLTNFNSDPEFNAFGKSRIFFADSMYYPYDYTNSSAGLNSNPYWDTGYAYRSEPTTTGVVADSTEPLIMHSYLMNDWNSQGYDGAGGTPTSDSPASNPAAAAVSRIAAYLNATWPRYSQSFVAKYGVREAEQIAWNIYGMAAASTTLNTGTTEGAWANTTYRTTYGTGTPPKNMRWSSFLWDGALGSGARILPQTRSPLVSKIGIGISLTQKDGNTPRRWILDPSDPTGTKTLQGTVQIIKEKLESRKS